MDLIHPERLLLLLPLLPLLWWLARPPRPRRQVLTAHLRLWQAAITRLRRRPVRFRKLRFWLMVAALLSVAVAATGLKLGARPGPRELVVILDASASSAAIEAEGDCAFDRLRARLLAMLDELPRGVEARVLVASDRPAMLRGDVEDLRRQLASIETGGELGSFDLDALARSDGAEMAVWVLSDGRGSLVEHGGVSFEGAESLPNAGITELRVLDSWPLPDLRVELRVSGDGPFEVEVEGGAEQSGELQAGDDGRLSLSLLRTEGGELRLRLRHQGEDALAADDEVTILLPPPPAPAVGVLRGAGSGRFLERAAAALAQLGDGEVVAAEPGADVGFLLAEGGQMAAGVGRVLSFGTAIDGAAVWGQGGRPLDWDRSHPLTYKLDLSELQVERALTAASLPDGGEVLVAGPEGPWLVAVERGGARGVHAAFRLEESNLALLPAFPQLLRRAFVWCYGAGAAPAVVEGALLSAEESSLVRNPGNRPREMPQLGAEGLSLVVPLLALAFLLLVARFYA